MKNKILLLIVILLSVVYFKSEDNVNIENNENKEISVLDTTTNEKETLDLENYLIGVVAAEMPALFETEALKAQAIAARSYALYKINNSSEDYDITTDVSTQSYINEEQMKNKWSDKYDIYYNKIKNAVDDTQDLVMYYNDEVIEAFYFAISNGNTEDCSLVFGSDFDYLQSVPSTWDKEVNNYKVETTYNKDEFCNKLNIECNNIEINNISKSASGRVNEISINGKNFKGTEFRKLLNLRSTDFLIEINNDIKITTYGYGHGVGMSQYGANEMAKLGYTYDEILKYYYKNIEINKINV